MHTSSAPDTPLVPGQAFQAQPNYAAWRVRPDEYRETRDLLKWAVLAPSSHNTQPWVFSVDDSSIVVSPDLARGLSVSDPSQRQLYLSLGAAIANLKVAARYFGLGFEARTARDGDPPVVSTALQFRPESPPSDEERRLFQAIAARASNRNAHQPRPLPAEFTDASGSFAGREVRVAVVEDQARKAAIGALLEQADLQILADPGFTGELASWLRANSTTASDGMPGFTFGLPDFLSRVFPTMARSGRMGPIAGPQDRELLAQQTAGIVVLTTERDDPPAWLAAGELFQRLTLLATGLGLGVNVYAALVETEPFPARLKAVLETEHIPQMMFRVGYPVAEAAHAPRRPAGQVVTVGPPRARTVIRDIHPTIFRLDKEYGLEALVADLARTLSEDGSAAAAREPRVVDRYAEDWLSELYAIRNPQLDFSTPPAQQAMAQAVQAGDSLLAGAWAYFPWKQTVAHVPERQDFFELLYSRNYPVIDQATQVALSELRVGIGGLSVGSNIARALTMLGVQRLRLADFDVIAPSNNNRIGAGSVLEVGQTKLSTLAHRLYEFNPFLELELYPAGVNASNLAHFMHGLDIFVDHLDDLPLKLQAREQARADGVIVLMATDLGFTPTFDVELPEDSSFFGGRLSKAGLEAVRQRPERAADWARLAVGLCGGPDQLPAAVLENFVMLARNKQNFASQLGLTGYAAAAELAYLVYEIARGNARKLERFKRLHLEQASLVDAERQRAAVIAFRQEFA